LTAGRFSLVPGVVWRELDDSLHAVYSPLSGDTHLLNPTAVWVLEQLAAPGWHDADDVVRQVALESEVPEAEMRAALGDVWSTLVTGGLVRRQATGSA
jgi:PqqD family protein of HPr-rel-A system